MRYLLMLFILTSGVGATDTVHAQMGPDSSQPAPSASREVCAMVAELRSALLKAELGADRSQLIKIAWRIVELTQGIDPSLPANFVVATDRLSALKALSAAHSSAAEDASAAETQEEVVELTRILHGARSGELLAELHLLGCHYGSLGRIVQQVAVLNCAIELADILDIKDTQVQLHSLLASRKMALGQYAAAAQDLRRAEAILAEMSEIEDPSIPRRLDEYYLALACYYIGTEPTDDKALRVLERRLHLMETTPGHPLAIVCLIELYSSRGEFRKAEDCVRKQQEYLRQHPNPMGELSLLIDRAYLAFERGEHDRAIELLTGAAYFKPGTYGGNAEEALKIRARRLLAEVHIERGQYAKARSLLEELTGDANPELNEYAITLYLTGRLHLRQKEYAEADQFLHRALTARNEHEKENPQWMRHHRHHRFLRDLIQLYRETNRPEKAEEIIQKSGIVEEVEKHLQGNHEAARTE